MSGTQSVTSGSPLASNDPLNFLLQSIRAAGGRPLMVGGAVRDQIMGFEPKDKDIEVYGLDADTAAVAMRPHGEVNAVGKSFGVLKVRLEDGQDIDVSLPRRDSKTSDGHKGFVVSPDPTMSPKEAAARRDFTMNAMAQDMETGEILDFYGGQQDIANGVLRHTSPAFAEDPLRVLRGIQFAGRFNMRLVPDTAALCQQLYAEADTLPKERVWGEWEKLLQKGTKPSAGMEALRDCGWIEQHPELKALIDCPQDPQWHPEGDVWQHTLHVMDAAQQIAERDGVKGDDRSVLMLAALCHDLGKPSTTVQGEDGRIRSPGHNETGIEPSRQFMNRIGAPEKVIEQVLPLVREHMAHISAPAEPRPMRRLATRLEPATIEQWGRVIEADHSGRPPLSKGNPAADHVRVAREQGASDGKPSAILMGRHLIAIGVKPGPQMGEILRQAYEAQMDGTFSSEDEAIQWARSLTEPQSSAGGKK
jgi:tRNA nucleotidyltransferase (CCA-adding enzyme)